MLDGVRVRLDTYKNKSDGSVYLDTYDAESNLLVGGLALATAGVDLWFPYRYKPEIPPGALFVFDSTGLGGEPGLEDFGDRFFLLYDEVT